MDIKELARQAYKAKFDRDRPKREEQYRKKQEKIEFFLGVIADHLGADLTDFLVQYEGTRIILNGAPPYSYRIQSPFVYIDYDSDNHEFKMREPQSAKCFDGDLRQSLLEEIGRVIYEAELLEEELKSYG
ncbi:hypothetical protein PMG71_05670 [Roseofilum sp. BLCC_M154]|uniref:DUF559 domain-containing protein n=1 Tax=Roseofilum acuticapitatum BLCC-M154 TaxID=3022444 RepID=A0ABT7AS79_9CYAN|nr:hypothetical protein [Roseofilum acuticapitatum]MDJ1168908.1 hypothetical protein [Roseofilum acuticapitatum BLCC-M154]